MLSIEKYTEYLDGRNLTTEQKEEIVKMVSRFLESYIDRALEQHEMEQSCGKSDENNLQSPAQSLGLNTQSIKAEFNINASKKSEE